MAKRSKKELKRLVKRLRRQLREATSPLLSCAATSCRKDFRQWRSGPGENLCRSCWRKLEES